MMKKIILTLLAAGSVAAVNAQSGSWLLYGNLDLNFYHQKDATLETQQYGSINPGIGYQFNDNWTVGLAGGFSILSTKDTTGAHTTKRFNTTQFNVGPFVRYTQPLSEIFAFYTQLEGGFLTGNTKFDNTDLPGYKYSGFYARLTPAIGVNVHNGFALNFGIGGIGYTSQKVKDASNSSSSFALTFGQQVNIGVSKNFGGHKAADKKHTGKKHLKHDEMNDE
ncbi:outer membrane beta-barrel protein [Chitinophagaceae bacterium MMS25-I14]